MANTSFKIQEELMSELLISLCDIPKGKLDTLNVRKFLRHVFIKNNFAVSFKNRELMTAFSYLNEFCLSRGLKTPEELRDAYKNFTSRFATFLHHSLTADITDRVDIETSYRKKLADRKKFGGNSNTAECFMLKVNEEMKQREQQQAKILSAGKQVINGDTRSADGTTADFNGDGRADMCQEDRKLKARLGNVNSVSGSAGKTGGSIRRNNNPRRPNKKNRHSASPMQPRRSALTGKAQQKPTYGGSSTRK